MTRGGLAVAAVVLWSGVAGAEPLTVTPSYVPRAHPPGPGASPAADTGYFYVAYGETVAMSGAGASVAQAKPRISTIDFHSLAEVAVESADAQQIIEIGWTVDPGVNTGDIAPHLFAYHWVDGVGTCYNGCGWVQTSSTHAPGMQVEVSDTPHAFRIEHRADLRWWLVYDGEDLGYYPDTLWTAHPYTQAGFTQWFGEVAAGSEASPCTEMGNAKRGTDATSDSFTGAYIVGATGTQTAANLQMTALTDAAAYAQGRVTASSFGFGGPGIPDPACTYYGDPIIPDDLPLDDASPSPDASTTHPAQGDSGGCCDAGAGGPSSVLLGVAVLGLVRRRRR